MFASWTRMSAVRRKDKSCFFCLQMTGRHIVGTSGCRLQLLVPVLRECEESYARADTRTNAAPHSPHQYLSTDDDVSCNWPMTDTSRPGSACFQPAAGGLLGDEGSLSDVSLSPTLRRNSEPVARAKDAHMGHDGGSAYINTHEHPVVFGGAKEEMRYPGKCRVTSFHTYCLQSRCRRLICNALQKRAC
jgi:hypothetical protein